LNGIGNNGIHDKVQLAFYRGTHRKDLHFHVIIAPLSQPFPYTISYTYMTYIGIHLKNTPILRRISPIEHPETLYKPSLLNYIMFLSICLDKGGFDAHVWVI
jgi:hypothetical protein